jgi:hypothetical protein
MFGTGGIDEMQFHEGNAAARAELERAEAALAAAAPADPLADLAGREDAAEAWARLDLGKRRAIVRLLLDVDTPAA